MDSTLNVQTFLEVDNDFGTQPITSFSDKRLNPFRPEYKPDVAWDFFNPMTTGRRCPRLSDEACRQACFQFVQWRFRYCEPNNPRCDRCAVFLNEGCFPGRVREPSYGIGSGIEACDTGGDTACRPCQTAGVSCTVFSLPADSKIVREYVRGRGFHWYEGVSRRPCDTCVAQGRMGDCNFWEGGCEVCKNAGIGCLINGHKPGSFAERMSRRQGYEHRISGDMCEKLGWYRQDEYYLVDRASKQSHDFGPPSAAPLTRALPAFPGVNPNLGYFATVEQAEAALKQMGIRGPTTTTLNSLAPVRSGTCEHCFRNKTRCTRDGPGSTCTRCATHGYKCVWLSAPAEGPIFLADQYGPVHVCLGCQNDRDWNTCDTELPRHMLAAGMGCTTCRRRGTPCEVRYDEFVSSDGSSGREKIVTLAPRPDGLTPPLCCDHCVEDPRVGLDGCSFRGDLRGAQEPDAPCRQCKGLGRLCTIGGYYFFGAAPGATLLPDTRPGTPPIPAGTAAAVPSEQQKQQQQQQQQKPPPFVSHLGPARPTHLFLTKRLENTAAGDVDLNDVAARGRLGAGAMECYPYEDYLVDIPGSRAVCWGRAAGGAEPSNRNVGLYMPGGQLAPLPELRRYGDEPARDADLAGGVSGGLRGGGILGSGV